MLFPKCSRRSAKRRRFKINIAAVSGSWGGRIDEWGENGGSQKLLWCPCCGVEQHTPRARERDPTDACGGFHSSSA